MAEVGNSAHYLMHVHKHNHPRRLNVGVHLTKHGYTRTKIWEQQEKSMVIQT